MSDTSNPKDAFGSSKVQLHLVPSALWIWVSEVFKLSALKYGPFNWRETKIRETVYYDAIGRHLLALMDGQWFDSESGKPHAAHIGANCAILLDADAQGTLVDDKTWFDGLAPELIAKLTQNTPIKIGGTE